MARDGGRRPRLGEVLVAADLLTEEQVGRALVLASERGVRLGETVVAEGILTQDQINWALAQHFGLSYVDVRHETLDGDFIRTLRPGLLYQHRVIPLVRIGDTLTLAMADPTDSDAVLEVSDSTGCDVECAIASGQAILAALDTIFAPEERRMALAAEPVADDFARMAAHPVPRQRLGEILIDALLITDEQLRATLDRQKGSGKRLGELLIDEGILTEDQINWALARHLDVPYIDLTPDMVEPELLALFPTDFLSDHGLVPMMRVANQVCVAIVDPLDHEATAEVASTTSCNVVVSIAPRRSVERILSRLERARRAAGPAPLPVDMLSVDSGQASAQREHETAQLRPLSAESTQAFKETIQQSALPFEDKSKVYETLHSIARARRQGGAQAERSARRQAFAALTPAAMKLALQLSHTVGRRQVPVFRDEEFQAKRGHVGRFFEGDRRFIVDRRAYDRTIREHARAHALDPVQIENAVMAARAYVVTEGRKQILLISKGEKALAEALTKIIRLAHTRERPPETAAPPYEGPDRRTTASDVQQAMDGALAKSGLSDERRDKVVRAFRVIHQALEGTYDRGKLKDLIRQGVFVGFSNPEIATVERILRVHGYDIS